MHGLRKCLVNRRQQNEELRARLDKSLLRPAEQWAFSSMGCTTVQFNGKKLTDSRSSDSGVKMRLTGHHAFRNG